MKILMALTYYYPHWTGLTAYAKRLAEGLAARGHKVTVLTARYDDLPAHDEHNGVEIVRLDSWFRLSRGQVTPSFIPVFNRLVRQHDVVQVHTPMLETWLVDVLAHRAGRKVVMTHHGDLVMPAGLMNQVVQKVVGGLLDLGAAKADCITTHSQDYADSSAYLRPYLFKLKAIYPPAEMPMPGADAIAAQRQALGLEGHKLVGFAGRFVEEKGFDFLLKAMPLVLERFPQTKFVFAGEHRVAYETFYERWHALWEQNAAHIVMMGLLTDQQALANFYGMCDVFALPSRTDCFPSVQIESLLCGTPLVTADIPGAREVVRVTGAGLIVKSRDEHALAEGIIRVLTDPAAYAKSHDQIRAVFDTEATLSAYESLLQSLC